MHYRELHQVALSIQIGYTTEEQLLVYALRGGQNSLLRNLRCLS